MTTPQFDNIKNLVNSGDLEKLSTYLDNIWSNSLIAHQNKIRSMVIAGPSKHQGVSFFAYHLAVFLAAEYGLKTLYFDTAIEKRNISPFTDKLTSETTDGFISYILDDKPLDQLTVSTSHPNFFIFPSGAGRKACRTGNLAGQVELISNMVEYCHQNFDITIFDSQPVTLTPWYFDLARQTDFLLLACKFAHVRKELVKITNDKIQKHNLELGGVVITDRPHPIPQFLYKWLN